MRLSLLGGFQANFQKLPVFIIFLFAVFTANGQKTKSARLPRKMAWNQRMQENKLALKFNFT